MDLNRKLEIAKQAISSGTSHDDEDGGVRKAFTREIREFLDTEDERIDGEVAARAAALFGAEG